LLSDKTFQISWNLFFQMMNEIGLGLKAIHYATPNPIFHRDLKTMNVLVTIDYHCRLADFGLSRNQVSENEITLNKCRGTAAYIAPEVYAQGQRFIQESDIYSISIILWEVVTRIILGHYELPYSEYKLKMDIQILLQAAQKQKRPTFKAGSPESLVNLGKSLWQVDALARGDSIKFLQNIEKINAEYEKDKKTWDALVLNQGNK